MNKLELRERFKKFAISIAHLVLELPYHTVNKNYCDQLSRSGSGAAANYCSALRAKSTADFINKLKIVEEELDESLFFLELTESINPSFNQKIQLLYKEGNELLSIIVASINTLRKNQILNRNS